MILKQWFYSNMVLRNMLADLFGRSGSPKGRRVFIPYFQYKLGRYQPDHYLYFPKEPYDRQYRNEIFNKLKEYTDLDIPEFLDFHYSAFPDNNAFLRFLWYGVVGRLNRKPNENYRLKLQTVQDWLDEKQHELKAAQEAALRQEIEKDVREVLPAVTPVSQESIESIALTLSEKLTGHIDQIMANTEEKMQTLTESYIIGKIELNNQNHEDKLMKFFKILQTVQAPPQIARAEQLFKSFSDTDTAAILWLHFGTFKNKKIETIPKNIRKADALIPDKNPKVKQLADAMRDFFYS